MIFDIYEQSDLFQIAKCGKRFKLIEWLKDHKIPYGEDSRGCIIAHKKAVEAGLGVESDAQVESSAELWLGDDNAA